MTLITVASWEERFLLGLKRVVAEQEPKHLLMFYYEEYAGRTLASRQAVVRLCTRKHIGLHQIRLQFENPVASWVAARNTIVQRRKHLGHTLVDISTMPRDLIWSILGFLRELRVSVTYIYNKPAKYHATWLSRDPGAPRLVYKFAGESRLGLRTTLLVVTGFDLERTQQLMEFFDPGETLLAIQTGPQFDNLRMNVLRHREFFGSSPDITSFAIDTYSGDHGLQAILQKVESRLRKANIVMASLGPKLSAISLFRIHMKHPQVGLAYTPSKDYNLHYSKGIGPTICGQLF